MHSGEARRLHFAQETARIPEWIGAADARKDRGLGHDRQNLPGHFHDNGVGVAIRHATGQRPAAGHAETAAVVDDDEINPARFLAFGADAGAGSAADDGDACGDLPAKFVQDRRAGEIGMEGHGMEGRGVRRGVGR